MPIVGIESCDRFASISAANLANSTALAGGTDNLSLAGALSAILKQVKEQLSCEDFAITDQIRAVINQSKKNQIILYTFIRIGI